MCRLDSQFFFSKISYTLCLFSESSFHLGLLLRALAPVTLSCLGDVFPSFFPALDLGMERVSSQPRILPPQHSPFSLRLLSFFSYAITQHHLLPLPAAIISSQVAAAPCWVTLAPGSLLLSPILLLPLLLVISKHTGEVPNNLSS